MEDLVSQLKRIEKSLHSVQERIQELLTQQADLQDKKTFLQAQIKSLEDQKGGLTSERTTVQAWESSTGFPWSEKLTAILKTRFQLDSFRPLQLSCINAVLSKKDVMLIMPTGSGKSLCYQLPALLGKGFALVVSPLVSLMEDQLMSVEKYSIGSAMLNSSSSRQQVNSVHSDMIDKTNDELKLVYVTPEKIAKSKRFMAKLEKAYNLGRLSCVVIDEVHCASQWGHDFRPDYKVLGILKRQFPDTPVMGLTATATSKVFNDCKSILNLSSCLVFKASYNRQNLFYEVREKPSSYKDQIASIETLINTQFCRQSGIVYCFSQKDAENVCHDLCGRGLKAGYYHANMSPKERTKVHNDWCSNKVQVIVATVAFGMGIDKPDVRFVIHHTLSKSVENYYQESGRAGRDGLPATCIIYYKLTDVFRQSTMVCKDFTGSTNLYSMVKYCINEALCRRHIIAQHFGEIWKSSDCNKLCDVCHQSTHEEQEDVTLICKGFIEVIDSKDKPMTGLMVIEAWRSSTIATTSEAFSRNRPSVGKLEKVLVYCLLENILQESFHFTPYNTISYIVLGKKADTVRLNRLTITMKVASKSSLLFTKHSELPLSTGNQSSSCSWLTTRISQSPCSSKATSTSSPANSQHHSICTSTPSNNTGTGTANILPPSVVSSNSTPKRTVNKPIRSTTKTKSTNSTRIETETNITTDSSINTTTDYSINTSTHATTMDCINTDINTTTMDCTGTTIGSAIGEVTVNRKKRSFIESASESDDDFISSNHQKTPSIKRRHSLPAVASNDNNKRKAPLLKRRQTGSCVKGKNKITTNKNKTFPSLSFATPTPPQEYNDIIEISDSD